jgi:general secretion pathway protein G
VGWFLFGFFTALACVATAVALVGAAAFIVPQFTTPCADARESALVSDLQTVRSQLELYKVQHLERYPDVDEHDKADTANFAARLTARTHETGRLDPEGAFGPYLQSLPTNPFVRRKAGQVSFGTGPPPGDGKTGWYYDTQTGGFFANDPEHKDL